MARKTGGLGKGISALIPDAEILVKKEDDSSSKPINNLKLSQVEPNPNQPRKTFDIENYNFISVVIERTSALIAQF